MTAISSLCHRAILLKSGSVDAIGDADRVVKSYLTPIRADGETRRRLWPKIADAPGDERVRVRSVELIAVGSPDADIELDTPINVIVDYWNLVEGANLIVEVIVNALDGTVVFHSLSSEDKSIGNTHRQRGLFRSICSIPGSLLNEGNYTIDIHFMHGAMSIFTSLVGALTLTVIDRASRGDFIYLGRFLGNVHPRLRWETALLETIVDQ
jgi:lipopolysaccharide transport system ATP-binding protein